MPEVTSPTDLFRGGFSRRLLPPVDSVGEGLAAGVTELVGGRSFSGAGLRLGRDRQKPLPQPVPYRLRAEEESAWRE